MMIILNTLIFTATFILMEVLAWFSHKYILHGVLWSVHKSHHSPRHGWFELNDVVSLLYGIVAAPLIYYGVQLEHWMLWVGIGITVYGVVYFIFHDIIIHRRIKIKYRFQHPYIKRLIRAHKIHHKHQEKEDSEAFGFLYAAKKYEQTMKRGVTIER